MDAFDHGDVFEVLRSRAPILVALSQSPKRAAELTAELSVSRSTINRGIHELERAGFVEVTDGTVRTSLSGRIVLETYSELVGQLDEIGSVGDAFGSLPSDTQFDPVMLDGSSSVVSEAPDDDLPFDRLISFIDRATGVRGCVQETTQSQIEAYYRRLHDDDIRVSLVATADVVEQLVTAYRAQLVELLGMDSFSLHSIDSLPYTLLVVELPDGPVAILVTYRSGRIQGVVHNDSPEAVAWARDQIDRWWTASESLPLSPH